MVYGGAESSSGKHTQQRVSHPWYNKLLKQTIMKYTPPVYIVQAYAFLYKAY